MPYAEKRSGKLSGFWAWWRLKPWTKVEYRRSHKAVIGVIIRALPGRSYLIQPDTMHITPLQSEEVPISEIIRVLQEA
jgi:hypothetical protein